MVSTFPILRDRSAHGAHACTAHIHTRAPANGTCSESGRRGRTFTPASRGRNSRSGRKAAYFGAVARCQVFPSCDWNRKHDEPMSAPCIRTSYNEDSYFTCYLVRTGVHCTPLEPRFLRQGPRCRSRDRRGRFALSCNKIIIKMHEPSPRINK